MANTACIEDMFMTAPPPDPTIALPASWQPNSAPLRSTAMTRSKSSSLSSSASLAALTAALLTMMWDCLRLAGIEDRIES